MPPVNYLVTVFINTIAQTLTPVDGQTAQQNITPKYLTWEKITLIFELCGKKSHTKAERRKIGIQTDLSEFQLIFIFSTFIQEKFIMSKFNKIAMAAAVLAVGLSAATASFAREASEGPRGEGKGHPAIETMGDVLAREASEGPRGEGKGHPLIDTTDAVLA